jgi:outer membrane protein OmpA-like peptidoglycan-associated protein
MTNLRILTVTVLAAAALAACSSMPASNASLDQARSDVRSAQADGPTQTLAALELKQATDALARAEAAFARRDDTAQVDQLAYIARQRAALARETGARKGSEAAVASAGAQSDKLRLDARTREADAATQTAAVATRDAASSQRQSEEAQRQAAASQRQSTAAQQQAAMSKDQADDAERRTTALQKQLAELNAKKTERGMVVTIGDVLFDTGQSQLKPGGVRNIERLSGFLKQYPQRKALIEGYTDSVGGESSNQALSGRRAESVMTTLLGMGVPRGQLASQGYGELYPVAGNESSGGRQANRRVEIVLSDENGALTTR